MEKKTKKTLDKTDPVKKPETEQPVDPEEPIETEDDPDMITEEDPFKNAPVEKPPPGEGP